MPARTKVLPERSRLPAGKGNKMKKPLILMILDGFGIAGDHGNAIKAANTPNLDKLFANNPITQIGASGNTRSSVPTARWATARWVTPTSAPGAWYIRS